MGAWNHPLQCLSREPRQFESQEGRNQEAVTPLDDLWGSVQNGGPLFKKQDGAFSFLHRFSGLIVLFFI